MLHKEIVILTEAIDALDLIVNESQKCDGNHPRLQAGVDALAWLIARLEDEQRAQADWERVLEA